MRDIKVTKPNQVWVADITCIPMARGFLYLVAVMDYYSRYVVAWRLSNTLEADFCVEALTDALEQGKPQMFNTDQGSQFTSLEFTRVLTAAWSEDQHGWEGKVPGQHPGGAAVEDGEIRGGASESLC